MRQKKIAVAGRVSRRAFWRPQSGASRDCIATVAFVLGGGRGCMLATRCWIASCGSPLIGGPVGCPAFAVCCTAVDGGLQTKNSLAVAGLWSLDMRFCRLSSIFALTGIARQFLCICLYPLVACQLKLSEQSHQLAATPLGH